MSRRLIGVGLLTAVSVMLTVVGCTRDSKDSDGQPEIEFAEANTLQIIPKYEPDAVATVRLVNTQDTPVTITRVEPLPDPGLKVWYLGHTTCKRGCAGVDTWATDDHREGALSGRQLAERSIDGKVPFTLKPSRDPTLSLVFHFAAASEAAEQRLRTRGCALQLRKVRLTLASGRKIVVNGPSDHVVGLYPPRPSDTSTSEQPPDCYS